MATKKSESAATAPVFVGVDDGFACTDVVVMDGGKVVKTAVVTSRARSGEANTTVIGGSEAETVPVFESEGETWTVEDGTGSDSARFDRYPFSSMNRAIVHQALRMAGLAGRDVHIATGLPLAKFYIGGKPNSAYIAEKKASLLKPVVAIDGQPTANVVAHDVFPEGLAAWVDYAVADGKMRVTAKETVGVIDIGGRTTDCAVVLEDRRIDHPRCGSAMAGALDVVAEIATKLSTRLNGAAISEALVDKALRAGVRTLSVRGKTVDFSDLLETALTQTLGKVKQEVSRRFGGAEDLERIILVGGGAYLFQAALLKDFPDQLYVPEQPEFANARGFAKYLSI
jgi:plasmid segregation protein ParM